jgi:hypothetical protein
MKVICCFKGTSYPFAFWLLHCLPSDTEIGGKGISSINCWLSCDCKVLHPTRYYFTVTAVRTSNPAMIFLCWMWWHNIVVDRFAYNFEIVDVSIFRIVDTWPILNTVLLLSSCMLNSCENNPKMIPVWENTVNIAASTLLKKVCSRTNCACWYSIKYSINYLSINIIIQ